MRYIGTGSWGVTVPLGQRGRGVWVAGGVVRVGEDVVEEVGYSAGSVAGLVTFVRAVLPFWTGKRKINREKRREKGAPSSLRRAYWVGQSCGDETAGWGRQGL